MVTRSTNAPQLPLVSLVPLKAAIAPARAQWQKWVGSVSSLMQKAAVRLLDAATVSNPPHCRRKTQPTPMSATAEDLPDRTCISMTCA